MSILTREFDTPDDLSRYNGKVRIIYQPPANLNRPHVEIATDFLIEWAESNEIIKVPDDLIAVVEELRNKKLAYKSLQLENKLIKEQLKEVQTQIQGIENIRSNTQVDEYAPVKAGHY